MAGIYNFAVSEVTQQIKNPWSDVNTSNLYDYDQYVHDVSLCRFFYRTEPIVATVINKLVEIGTSDLVISKSGLSDNEYRVFLAIKPDLENFAEAMAQEFLLSGLVVPEYTLSRVDRKFLTRFGIKKYGSLKLPDSMWVRDPKSIKIYPNLMSDSPVFYVKIPEDFVNFIRSDGVLPNGVKNQDLYSLISSKYPGMVKAVKEGKDEILLENGLVIRRKYLSDSPYPIPYISPALEALQHKRKLRRMDYSIIDKVISAIMHVKVGSDEFPISDSEEDQQYVEDISRKLKMRADSKYNLERIFQLVTNHTVSISWVFPDSAILLDSKKYSDINQEILFALGFPRHLVTGESERTGTSDPEIAMISPVMTMENFRRKIIEVVREVCRDIATRNGFRGYPDVFFKDINMHKFSDFLHGISKLFEISAISRRSFAESLGYDFAKEVEELEEETNLLMSKKIPLAGISPYSSPDLIPTTDDNKVENDTQ